MSAFVKSALETSQPPKSTPRRFAKRKFAPWRMEKSGNPPGLIVVAKLALVKSAAAKLVWFKTRPRRLAGHDGRQRNQHPKVPFDRNANQ